MKKLNLLILLFIVLSVSSCSSNDNKTNTAGSIAGNYNLISIESSVALDPDVGGEFNDLQIIDNISCSSTMVLNSDGSINWNYLKLTQTLNSEKTSYSEIECQEINGINGQYQITYDGINITFDPSLNIIRTFINGDLLNVIISENLVNNFGGDIQKTPVQLKFIYLNTY